MIIKEDMLENIKIVWANKSKILSGIWNSWFPSYYIERIAKHRLAICQENKCGFYDEKGKCDKAFIKGSPTCCACGCNSNFATHSLSKVCGLSELGLTPLWEAEMTEKEEDKFREKSGIKNE